MERVNAVQRLIAVAEAAWAQKTVTLAEEPPGDRCGFVGAHRPGDPLRFVAIGDSLVAGSGVDHQGQGLTPLVAELISAQRQRPVQWETHAKLGATLRRVRYRYLPEVHGVPDYLLICAGTNDVLARRTVAEWSEDLAHTVSQAQKQAVTVFVCSAGQPHESPVLPRTLRKALGEKIDAQTAASRSICARQGVTFTDVTRVPLPDGFWAADGFHPSAIGYAFAASHLSAALFPESSADTMSKAAHRSASGVVGNSDDNRD